jgi:hypothetical protein
MTLPGGDGWGLSLGAVNSAPITATQSKSWLFSLYAGLAHVRFVVFGAAGTNTVKFSLAPLPSGRWGTTPIYAAWLPIGAAAFQQQAQDTVPLPRGPCQLTVQNLDANNVTVDIEIVVLEP